MKFKDVVIEEKFIEEWENAPLEIRNRVDTRIIQLAKEKVIRPSAHLHKAKGYKNHWIMYLTLTVGSWRIILSVENQILYMKRLFDHQDMMAEYGYKN